VKGTKAGARRRPSLFPPERSKHLSGPAASIGARPCRLVHAFGPRPSSASPWRPWLPAGPLAASPAATRLLSPRPPRAALRGGPGRRPTARGRAAYLTAGASRDEYALRRDDRTIARVRLVATPGGRELARKLAEDQLDAAFGGFPALAQQIDQARRAHRGTDHDRRFRARGPPGPARRRLGGVRHRARSAGRPLRIGYRADASVQKLVLEQALARSAIPVGTEIDDSRARVILVNLLRRREPPSGAPKRGHRRLSSASSPTWPWQRSKARPPCHRPAGHPLRAQRCVAAQAATAAIPAARWPRARDFGPPTRGRRSVGGHGIRRRALHRPAPERPPNGSPAGWALPRRGAPVAPDHPLPDRVRRGVEPRGPALGRGHGEDRDPQGEVATALREGPPDRRALRPGSLRPGPGEK